jgi:hypothetical protein
MTRVLVRMSDGTFQRRNVDPHLLSRALADWAQRDEYVVLVDGEPPEPPVSNEPVQSHRK